MATNPPPDDLTPAQEEALKKAWDILGEHFDRVLLVVDTETPQGQQDAHAVFWQGGALPAIGMASYAHQRLLERNNRNHEPTDE